MVVSCLATSVMSAVHSHVRSAYRPGADTRESFGTPARPTPLLTPLTFQKVANPSANGVVVEGIFASGFLTDAPLLAAFWAYLSLSFALGSVPSDKTYLVPLLVVFGGGILLLTLLRTGSSVLYGDLRPVRAASGLYAHLP